MPAISVIMSIYSEPLEWIRKSIDSILQQSFSDFEFIIINDNPNRSENQEILVRYQQIDQRIVLILNDMNIGLTRSLNKGLRLAKGKYVARMDADDISLAFRFEKQFDFMEKHPEIGVCGGWIKYFGCKDLICKYPEDHHSMFLFYKSVFAHPVVFIRKEVLSRFQLQYDETLRYSQDYDLWERLYPYCQFHNLPEILLYYRISDHQISSNHTQEQLKITSKIRRRAFNRYCDIHHINYNISSKITFEDIVRYKLIFLKKQQLLEFDVNDILYYIYRSIDEGFVKVFFYLCFSGDCFKFSLGNLIKIFYCYFCNRNRYKLLS